MTFGIDISTHQAGLDIGAARRAGAEFVIVKSVASYLPHLTVADHYEDGIDRTIDAGLGHAKGHYAVPNSQNTPEATAEFQMDIVHRQSSTDVFMLDNEPLNTYKTYWRDELAAKYFYRLNDLGIRYSQMWLYCPASLTRSSGPWPRIEELRKEGLKVHWVSYGPNYPGPTGMVPDHEPYLGTAEGRITGWDVHQFTSNWRIPEYGDRIDGNYSPLSVGELFGGVPVSLEQKARDFAARYPTSGSHPSGGDNDWDQDCGRVCYRFASSIGWSKRPSEGSVYSAYAVAMASGWLNPNAAAAPIGAWHFWDIGGPANGHVGTDLTGGGRRVFMGTWSVAEDWGRAIGVLSVAGYTAAKAGRARYLGWATNYAGGTVNLSGLAGLGTTPIGNTPTQEQEKDMALESFRDENGTIAFIDEAGADNVGKYFSPDIPLGSWLEVMENVFGKTTQLGNVQHAIASAIAERRAAEKRAQVVTDVVSALTPLLKAITPTVDPAVVEAAIQKGLEAQLANIEVAAKFTAEDFAAIADAVADEQADRLSE